MKWLTVAGLVLNTIGAGVVLCGSIISKKQAMILGWGHTAAPETPGGRDRWQQSKAAMWGMGFLVIGFILQLIAALVSA